MLHEEDELCEVRGMASAIVLPFLLVTEIFFGGCIEAELNDVELPIAGFTRDDVLPSAAQEHDATSSTCDISFLADWERRVTGGSRAPIVSSKPASLSKLLQSPQASCTPEAEGKRT